MQRLLPPRAGQFGVGILQADLPLPVAHALREGLPVPDADEGLLHMVAAAVAATGFSHTF